MGCEGRPGRETLGRGVSGQGSHGLETKDGGPESNDGVGRTRGEDVLTTPLTGPTSRPGCTASRVSERKRGPSVSVRRTWLWASGSGSYKGVATPTNTTLLYVPAVSRSRTSKTIWCPRLHPCPPSRPSSPSHFTVTELLLCARTSPPSDPRPSTPPTLTPRTVPSPAPRLRPPPKHPLLSGPTSESSSPASDPVPRLPDRQGTTSLRHSCNRPTPTVSVMVSGHPVFVFT